MTEKPPKTLSDLPHRLQNKIRVDGEDERLACWIWTGSFTKPRHRHRGYRVPAGYTGARANSGTMVSDRGTPMVHASELGYPTSAARVVYARFHDIPLAVVPRLGRCPDDRCVSPHHVQDLGPVIKGTPHAAAMRELEAMLPQEHTPPHPRPVPTDDPNVEQPLDTLKRVRPFSGISIESAEDECELPRGSITPTTWAEYVAWDEANPEDD
jgi:hypothetical protein